MILSWYVYGEIVLLCTHSSPHNRPVHDIYRVHDTYVHVPYCAPTLYSGCVLRKYRFTICLPLHLVHNTNLPSHEYTNFWPLSNQKAYHRRISWYVICVMYFITYFSRYSQTPASHPTQHEHMLHIHIHQRIVEYIYCIVEYIVLSNQKAYHAHIANAIHIVRAMGLREHNWSPTQCIVVRIPTWARYEIHIAFILHASQEDTHLLDVSQRIPEYTQKHEEIRSATMSLTVCSTIHAKYQSYDTNHDTNYDTR